GGVGGERGRGVGVEVGGDTGGGGGGRGPRHYGKGGSREGHAVDGLVGRDLDREESARLRDGRPADALPLAPDDAPHGGARVRARAAREPDTRRGEGVGGGPA